MKICCNFRWGGVLAVVLVTAQIALAQKKEKAAPAPKDNILVVVNGQKIREGELNRLFLTRKISDAKQQAERDRFIEQLIDTELVRQFLDKRDAKAPKKEVEDKVNQIRNAAKQRGSDPDKVLADLGYTAQSLRDEFALTIAWEHYVDLAVPNERLRKYFDEHRIEFDGTKVRARRILIKPTGGSKEEWQAAEETLAKLRQQIVDKKITFEEAAREHSHAPSKDQGGDVGEFPFMGKMPAKFSREAFRLEIGEISQPFATQYGMELCLVTDRQPGEISLEDVRDIVMSRLKEEMWKQTIADMRKAAKIEWKIAKQTADDDSTVK